MVFRFLTDDELSLLNDKEREAYERQRIDYEKRVNFVKKLELLENVEFKPYKCKKKKLVIKDRTKISPVSMPECAVDAANTVSGKIKGYRLLNKIDSKKMAEAMHLSLKTVPQNSDLLSKMNSSRIKVSMPELGEIKPEVRNINAPDIGTMEMKSAVLNSMPDISTPSAAPELSIAMPQNKPVNVGMINIKAHDVQMPALRSAKVSGMPEKFVPFVSKAAKINIGAANLVGMPANNRDSKDTLPVFRKISVGNTGLSCMPEPIKTADAPSLNFSFTKNNITAKPVVPENAPSLNFNFRKSDIRSADIHIAEPPEIGKYNISAVGKPVMPEKKICAAAPSLNFSMSKTKVNVADVHIADVQEISRISMPSAKLSNCSEIRINDKQEVAKFKAPEIKLRNIGGNK